MRKVVSLTGLNSTSNPNLGKVSDDTISDATAVLSDVVKHANDYLHTFYTDYNNRINPLINEEIDKLSDLRARHMDYQLSLFESERKKSEQERRVDELFDRFVEWVTETLEIKDNPYIRIITVVTGGK